MGNEEKTEETLRYHAEDLESDGVGGLKDGEQPWIKGRKAKNGARLRPWMHTGAEGRLDADSYLVFTSRIKDLIIRDGENINPLEIEERLSEHECIASSAVIGVPDDKYGEAVGAFLEVAEGKENLEDDQVRDWVREKLARFKAPKDIWWLGQGEGVPKEWPKTMSGKVSKPELREIVKGLVGGQKPKAKL